jgi:hypothetical protein
MPKIILNKSPACKLAKAGLLTKKERAKLKWWAEKYVDNGAYCLKHKINVGAALKT